MMVTHKRFNPVSYVTVANEDKADDVVQVAYNLSSPTFEELPVKNDVEATVDQELVDLDNLYQDMHDVDTRLKTIAHEGHIGETAAEEISEKYPGVIVTDPTALEGRGGEVINLSASVENLKRVKLGLLVSALISIIGILLAWVKRTRNKTKPLSGDAATQAPVVLSGILNKTDIDIPLLYTKYLDIKNNKNHNQGPSTVKFYTTVGNAIEELLGRDASIEKVKQVFSGKAVTYASIFANCGPQLHHIINREMLTEAEGLTSMEKDTKFLETGRYEFRSFVDDCAKFSNEIPRWLNGMKDGVAVGKDGRTLSPETKINTVNLDVIVNMSKTLGLALDQPTVEVGVQDAHQFITINNDDINNRIRLYRNQVTGEPLTPQKLAHLNEVEKIITVLETQEPALIDWKKQIRASSSTLGNMSRQLKQVRDRINNMPRDASLKADELENLANMIVANFSCMSRYIVVVDRFNATTLEGMKKVVTNIYTLNKTISEYGTSK